jgi:hypothetical protein
VQPLPPAVAAFTSPTTLGSLTYDQNDVLGEGSLGTKMYRGRHHDGREVAVKVMMKGVVPEHRAEREMQLLQTIAEGEGRGRQHVIQYRVCVQSVLLLYGYSIYDTPRCITYGVAVCRCVGLVDRFSYIHLWPICCLYISLLRSTSPHTHTYCSLSATARNHHTVHREG